MLKKMVRRIHSLGHHRPNLWLRRAKKSCDRPNGSQTGQNRPFFSTVVQFRKFTEVPDSPCNPNCVALRHEGSFRLRGTQICLMKHEWKTKKCAMQEPPKHFVSLEDAFPSIKFHFKAVFHGVSHTAGQKDS